MSNITIVTFKLAILLNIYKNIRIYRILSNQAIYLVNRIQGLSCYLKSQKSIPLYKQRNAFTRHYFIFVTCEAFTQPVFVPSCPTYHVSLPIMAVDVGLNVSPAKGFIVVYRILRDFPFGRV